MTTDIPQDSPPSYEAATEDGHDHTQDSVPKGALNHDSKHSASTPSQPSNGGPSYTAQPGYTSMSTPLLHHYVNPNTGEHIATLQAPNDPEMICLQEGMHIPHTRYGLLGVLAAVFWFPLGIGLCLLDRHTRCQRCGAVLNNGLCE
ncbi:hypothetical protein H0H92_007055 [Tricholoma furcatifolium]|nr:hypothetical protein H0H92_007055 [Tricholoma furcatifolium]